MLRLGRLRDLRHRCHRRHLAQARLHAGDFLHATRHQAGELGGGAVTAVVEHQDVGHAGTAAGWGGDDTLGNRPVFCRPSPYVKPA